MANPLVNTAAAAVPINPMRWKRLQFSSLRARVLTGTGANLISQAVTVGIQVFSLPLFLHFWTTEHYGKWLMLSAIPAYFSMSDAGVIPVAANKITMLHAAGRPDEADSVFQSALALVLCAIALISVSTGLAFCFVDEALLGSDSRLALWLMILATLSSLFGGLFDSGFRTYGRYAEGVLLGNGVRIIEFAGTAAGLAIYGSFSAAAAGMFTGRLVGTLALASYCRRQFPALHWQLGKSSLQELRTLLNPAAAFMAFPLGNALSIQAITLMVGGLFGGVAVAIFNTYRTLSRVVIQLTSTLSLALWADFSRLFGASDGTMLRRVYGQGFVLGAAVSLVLSAAMIFAAPSLLSWWTHGKITFDRPLFLAFAGATFIGGVWHVPRVLLLSTNCHRRLGWTFLALSTLGVGAAWIGARAMGDIGIVLTMLVLEAAMLGVSMWLVRGVLTQADTGRPTVSH